MKNNKIVVLLPVIVAVTLIVGVWIGKKMAVSSVDFYLGNHPNSSHKLNQIINYIQSDYVDTIQENWIVDKTVNGILEQLDPHSSYIPGDKYHAYNDPLEGNFEGIGIEFRIQEDTVVVAKPIQGGPSEKRGVLAGDRIVEVNGENITGSTLNNTKVMKLLKGPKGSEVEIGIKRKGVGDLIAVAIERDKIPIYSVESAYMIEEEVGYIKISRFAKTTYDEFKTSTEKLKREGMKKLIVDLRGNSGGYMKAATDLSDEFLENGKLIVYTEGKARRRQDFKASRKGNLEETELIVLINEGSASASEIFAGAIQDQDRGVIAGRRSFGKGLVQEPMEWSDGSQVRLTVARYYTPSGRSIQKAYQGKMDSYDDEYFSRFESGELFSKDSIPVIDSLVFYTSSGREVFGGGGITPDLFIPMDTSGGSSYFSSLNYMAIFYQYGFEYVDIHRESLLQQYNASTFSTDFKMGAELKKDFFDFASQKGINYDAEGAKASERLIENRIKASIGRNLFGDDVFYQVLNREDLAVQECLKYLEKKKPA